MKRLLFLLLAFWPLTAEAQLFGRQQQPTVSSTIYIDPTAAAGGTGTCLSPFNTWVGRSLTGNVAFLQRGGTTFTGTTSPVLSTVGSGSSVYSPLILGTYDATTCNRVTDGSQRAIIDAANVRARGIEVGHNFVTIDSLEIKNTSNGMCIYWDTNVGQHGVVKNSYLHNCRDAGADNAAGIFAFSPNAQFTNNIIDTVGTDGIIAQGVNLIITGNTITNISVDQTDGDGIQISNDVIDSSNPYVAFNTINHSCCTDNKSSIFISNAGAGSSTGCQVLFNNTIGYLNSAATGGIGIGYPNCFVYGNQISQGWRGIDVLAAAINARVVGNVITNPNVNVASGNINGIVNNGAVGLIASNNVIINTTGTFANSTTGISSQSGDILINNIIQGWKNGINGSGTASFSDFFGNQTNGTIGTGSITTDPLFVGGGNYSLQSGSGAKGTGSNPNIPVVTAAGIVMSSPFNMGAY